MADTSRIESRELRNALGCFPTGVAVVTATDPQGLPVGLTCNSFSSVSLEPALVCWSLRLDSRNMENFRRCAAFSINILAEDQHDLSSHFASNSATSKFESVAWEPGILGSPRINDCVATFECGRHAEYTVGDHRMFIGEVCSITHGRREPSLVFYQGTYSMLSPSIRELVAISRAEPAKIDEARRLVNCTLLRLACERATEDDFDTIALSIRDVESCSGDGDIPRRIAASGRFFRCIAIAAHNDVLLNLSDTLSTIQKQLLKADSELRERVDLVPFRKSILKELRRRDLLGAEAAMNAYFDALRRGRGGHVAA